MIDYTEVYREWSKGNRKCTKDVFKLGRRIWRGVNNGRFTFEDIFIIFEKAGAANEK